MFQVIILFDRNKKAIKKDQRKICSSEVKYRLHVVRRDSIVSGKIDHEYIVGEK